MAKTPWEMAAVGKEFSHQTALFAWAAMARNYGIKQANDPESYTLAGYAKRNFEERGGPLLPELKWLHAIKNQGHGDRIRGARSAAEGLRRGVFDTFLPVPSFYGEEAPFPGAWTDNDYGDKRFHGLYIELKTPDRINHKDGGASQEQLDFQADMRANGYAAEVCHGWEAARDCIIKYLGKG